MSTVKECLGPGRSLKEHEFPVHDAGCLTARKSSFARRGTSLNTYLTEAGAQQIAKTFRFDLKPCTQARHSFLVCNPMLSERPATDLWSNFCFVLCFIQFSMNLFMKVPSESVGIFLLGFITWSSWKIFAPMILKKDLIQGLPSHSQTIPRKARSFLSEFLYIFTFSNTRYIAIGTSIVKLPILLSHVVSS